MAHFSDLLGRTLTRVEGLHDGSEQVHFYCEDGMHYRLMHHQQCCESVALVDLDGTADILTNTDILLAEISVSVASDEDISETGNNPEYEGGTWSFYKLATVKGYVTMRWLGISNGYYSQEVSFERV